MLILLSFQQVRVTDHTHEVGEFRGRSLCDQNYLFTVLHWCQNLCLVTYNTKA